MSGYRCRVIVYLVVYLSLTVGDCQAKQQWFNQVQYPVVETGSSKSYFSFRESPYTAIDDSIGPKYSDSILGSLPFSNDLGTSEFTGGDSFDSVDSAAHSKTQLQENKGVYNTDTISKVFELENADVLKAQKLDNKYFPKVDKFKSSYTNNLLSSIGLYSNKKKPSLKAFKNTRNNPTTKLNRPTPGQNIEVKLLRASDKQNRKIIKAKPLTKSKVELSKPKPHSKVHSDKTARKDLAKMNIDEKKQRLLRTIQILKTLKKYSELNDKEEPISKVDDTRKHLFDDMKTFGPDENIYSSKYVPEQETQVSNTEAMHRQKAMDGESQAITTNDFLKSINVAEENPNKHRYITIDTTTGNIVNQKSINIVNPMIKECQNIGECIKDTKQDELKSLPPNVEGGTSRHITDDKLRTMPQIMISVSAEHRTNGKVEGVKPQKTYKKEIKVNKEWYENGVGRGKIRPRVKTNIKTTSTEREQYLNDISDTLKFVSTNELKGIKTKLKLLKFYRSNLSLKQDKR